MPKLLYGIAECDKGSLPTKGSRLHSIWTHMLRRCYCPETQIKKPTYVGCEVDARFLKFQAFAEWASKQPGSLADWQLDKDILILGNKIYGPDTCAFVPPELNKAMRRVATKPNGLPIGVTLSGRGKKYRASVCINDSYEHIGHFETVEEAFNAHVVRKCEHMLYLAEKWRFMISDRVYSAIIGHVEKWQQETKA